MARQVDVDEAQRQFDELLDRVEAGEEIVIARGGRPVAWLILPSGFEDDLSEGRPPRS